MFVEGHWDYPLEQRGLLFCPVYYRQPMYLQAGYAYQPAAVVNVDALTFHFFCWLRYRHYCFGDFYGASYAQAGIVPWFELRVGYDPLFTYYHWYYRRSDPNWDMKLRQWYTYYDKHPEMARRTHSPRASDSA